MLSDIPDQHIEKMPIKSLFIVQFWKCKVQQNIYRSWIDSLFTLGVVAEWSKVLTAVPWPLMVWSTLALGTYQLRFVSWVFHVIFSFVHFISLYILGGLLAYRMLLPDNMYLFNLRIANHILIKINKDHLVIPKHAISIS